MKGTFGVGAEHQTRARGLKLSLRARKAKRPVQGTPPAPSPQSSADTPEKNLIFKEKTRIVFAKRVDFAIPAARASVCNSVKSVWWACS
jgi:hypothetical protein